MFSIEVISESSSVATEDELKSVVVDGHHLPESFRKFSSEFGYGRFGGLVIVLSGVPQHPDSIVVQGARIKSFFENAIVEGYFECEPDGSEEIVGHLYPFAASENGEYFAWDVSREVEGEYKIYCVGARMAGVRYAAASFDELLLKLCSDSIKTVMGPGYTQLLPTFQGL